MNQIITTADGSHTIFVPELNEHYHSVFGAVQESNFIFIKTGFDFCMAAPLNIFEVGFGTGLNALLTAIKSKEGERVVNYTTIEKYPINLDTVNLLNHHLYAGEDSKAVFELLHSSPWNQKLNICKNFNFMKILGDITVEKLSGKFDLIYFDAFGPDKQPHMWSSTLFDKISSITRKNGVLVTYSVKGEVKRALRGSGFTVTRMPGPPGKRQIIRAIKN